MPRAEAWRRAWLEREAAAYRVAGDAKDAARERLYAAVRAAYAGGMSMRAIAEAVGLSHARVQQIVGEDGP